MVISGVTIENYVKSCEDYRQLREMLSEPCPNGMAFGKLSNVFD